MNLTKEGLTDPIDKEIYSYLNLEDPKSFLLFAGAGSGKTRTLVNVLQELRREKLHQLVQAGQQVAIITYTNAACDEIKHRLQYDPIFKVSTIHSFAWSLIRPFTEDIKERLKDSLKISIDDLNSKLERARDKTGKTAIKNAKRKDNKEKRLAELAQITKFTYSASSNNTSRGSINHDEVITITADLIENNPLLQTILTNRFPILLIDESQDTKKNLLESFIEVQKNHSSKFCLGLFGDMMQRIYGGGKEDLDTNLPNDWKKPEKVINYRCPKRVISLINSIRVAVDPHEQKPKDMAVEGYIRLFIVDLSIADKFTIEEKIRNEMASYAKDKNWSQASNVKCLILEHAMAAKRGGFSDFFLPLYKSSELKDSVIKGDSRNIRFITNQALPLIGAIKQNDDFLIADIIKKYSPLLSLESSEFINSPIKQIHLADSRIKEIKTFLDKKRDPCFLDILKSLHEKKLLPLPDTFIPYLEKSTKTDSEDQEDANLESETSKAWESALNVKLSQVIQYAKYISGELSFATHQGVKGLQFDRVMVILGDDEANGFLFSYEKLFGAKELTVTDKKKEAEGNDSSPMRTRRLFYVICSRAEESLAVVSYTKNPQAVKQYALQSKWFEDHEIVMF